MQQNMQQNVYEEVFVKWIFTSDLDQRKHGRPFSNGMHLGFLPAMTASLLGPTLAATRSNAGFFGTPALACFLKAETPCLV